MAFKKIAIGGIITECSSYSPLYQKESDFTVVWGQELLDLVNFPFADYNLEAQPIFFSKSAPGGPVENQYFSQIKEQLKTAAKSLALIAVLITLLQLYQILISQWAPGAAMDSISTVITALFAIGFFMKSR